MSIPVFSEDSTEQSLDDDDDLSGSAVKGAIKWEDGAAEYVFVWWQTPFRILFSNGGYSMSDELLERIPDHIDAIWVVDEERGAVRRFERAQFDDGMHIGPGSDKFTNVAPAPQTAVPCDDHKEEHTLSEVESLH